MQMRANTKHWHEHLVRCFSLVRQSFREILGRVLALKMLSWGSGEINAPRIQLMVWRQQSSSSSSLSKPSIWLQLQGRTITSTLRIDHKNSNTFPYSLSQDWMEHTLPLPPRQGVMAYIVKSNADYPELATLSQEVREFGDILVTKSEFGMLGKLVKTIDKRRNNVLVLLTKDIEMDGYLYNQLIICQAKKVRIILYPHSLGDSNTYMIANTKEEILGIIQLLYSSLNPHTREPSIKLVEPQPNPMQLQVKSFHDEEVGVGNIIIKNPTNDLGGSHNVSTEDGKKPMGVRVLRSTNSEFNLLMDQLSAKYKEDPLVSFTQVSNIGEVCCSNITKQILVVSESESEGITQQILNLNNLDQKVFTIKLVGTSSAKKHYSEYTFETHRGEDIEYLVDTALNELNRAQKSKTPPAKSNVDSLAGRIQMKSLKRVQRMDSKRPPKVYVFETNSSSEFTAFHQDIPIDKTLISNLDQMENNNYPLVVIPLKQFATLIPILPPKAMTILYAKSMTPNTQIDHPSVLMITSNRQQLIRYLAPPSSNPPANQTSTFSSTSGPGLPKATSTLCKLNLSGSCRGEFPNGQRFMGWVTKKVRGDFRTIPEDQTHNLDLITGQHQSVKGVNEVPTQSGDEFDPQIGILPPLSTKDWSSGQRHTLPLKQPLPVFEVSNGVSSDCLVPMPPVAPSIHSTLVSSGDHVGAPNRSATEAGLLGKQLLPSSVQGLDQTKSLKYSVSPESWDEEGVPAPRHQERAISCRILQPASKSINGHQLVSSVYSEIIGFTKLKTNNLKIEDISQMNITLTPTKQEANVIPIGAADCLSHKHSLQTGNAPLQRQPSNFNPRIADQNYSQKQSITPRMSSPSGSAVKSYQSRHTNIDVRVENGIKIYTKRSQGNPHNLCSYY